MTSVDQLVKENVVLIKENPRFVEEGKHLQMALSYMTEEKGLWKFKSSVPTANAMNLKNTLGRDNIRMKEIAQKDIRRNSKSSWAKNDKTKKWILIALATGAVGVGIYLFLKKKKVMS